MEQTDLELCTVCGNEQETRSRVCRFCGAERNTAKPTEAKPLALHRSVNLERGRPTVEMALKRLDVEMIQARAAAIRVLTLIHGYGSSGKGGSIRVECRKVLDYLVQQKRVNSVINGEDFNRRSGAGKDVLRRFPELEQACGSDFNNPGVTIVLM